MNNLFLGLAVGVVAFELNQLLSHPSFADLGLTAAVWSVVLAGASAIGGLLTSITRLLDFRATAAIWTCGCVCSTSHPTEQRSAS